MDADTLVGRHLGPYVIAHELGRGGMGVVYQAHDTVRKCDVALKTRAPSVAAIEYLQAEWFRREALWLFHSSDPHIAHVYDAGRTDGVDYIAMELMTSTLQMRIAAGSVDPLELPGLGAQILLGLAAAHRAGIIHRDVKPANIGIAGDGVVKLLDFGVADALPWSPHFMDAETSASRIPVAGSVPYMSPEQLRDDSVDERSDIYSTGVVLYELACGHPPFRLRNAVCLIDAILNRVPRHLSTRNADLPRALADVIMRALAKKPSARYPSALAMMDALFVAGSSAWHTETAVWEEAVEQMSAHSRSAVQRFV